ncbi:head-tail connector protein [Aquamicrobium ahrensii]|uniref:PhiE125 gp8 family phage protein n=1 Tax=Aquamicrobium ahrensii TaxID=469551 RepID=A0ABV2KN49_9HYPH
MLAPVLITPPAITPVSLIEARAHLRVDHNDDDTLIAALISAAVDHLDGWTGILGRCLVEQEWRQNSDVSGSCVMLPLGPVIEIVSVTSGSDTIDPANYKLKTDAGDRSRVEFGGPFSGLMTVTYKAGYATIPQEDGPPVVPEQSTVPDALKVAILLLVGNWYANRETSSVPSLTELPFAVSALIAPYRRVGI